MISFYARVLLFSWLAACAAAAPAQTRIFSSPEGQLRAMVMPVGKKGWEQSESRIELRTRRGGLLRYRSFVSADGEHGYGVAQAAWSSDGQFFVISLENSGGHQPWHRPIYFYSRRENRFYELGDYIGPVTSDFSLIGRSTVKTTRFNFAAKNEREPVTIRLDRLLVRRNAQPPSGRKWARVTSPR